jgi:hypothetical protein
MFRWSSSPHCALTVGYKDKYIEETINTESLGLQLDNHLNWEDHTDQMVPKLIGAYYPVRSMFHISNMNTLKSIYFAYFHSVITYRIILGGKSSNSWKIFTLQKKVIRTIGGACLRIRYIACSMPTQIFINELPCKQSRKLPNNSISTQY